ncbi:MULTISPECIES: hypothetical protein [unclassified Pseudomonas]|uniref:hypothetical protein n=1 Tax=unclassified Pseudomonas TaxID=196821 RepID=UPI00244757C4|nr:MULTISPECIES: hypothetical protein [unclassified Pseudomonas]MDG9922445.1 hypothetical protein [Pseudomonas sp. GD04045]MDH0034357.1 hypothetical protein [Pseudomonas sp. GD04019]
MPRLLRQHAQSGALAGFGLFAIAASVLLSMVLGLGDERALSGGASQPDALHALLAAIRVGG